MITYAGVELCFEDPEGLITAWIERFAPLEDLRDQTFPAALRSQRPASRSDYQPGVNLPLPNYPDPPRAKLSTLYWPSGAARWARGYFLCTGGQLDEILAATAGGDEPATVVMADQDNDTAIEAQMYVLAPRSLTAATGGDELLFLLTLVDQRYFWQFVDSGALKVTRQTTWTQVFSQLEAQLDITIGIDAIASAYGIPDPDELTRPYENAALLLDACAHSVGMVVVADLDGAIFIIQPVTSEAVYQANVAAQPTPLAGGDFSLLSESSAYPQQVTVTFQKWREGAVYPNGDLHHIDVQAGAVGFGGVPGRTKLVHSTAFADFTSLSSLPDNAANLQALATQIALDYYQSLSRRYDLSIASIFPWDTTGFDDHVEWSLGRLCGGGQYQAQTRVQSLPYNFGEEEQLQQFADKPVYPSPTRFKLSANLVPLTTPTNSGQSAQAIHQRFDDTVNQWVDTTDTLKVWDPHNAFPGVKDEYGYAVFKADSLRWEIVSLDNRFLHGKLNAAMTPGLSAQVTIWTNTAGSDSATSMVVTAWDWLGTGFPSGAKVFLRYDPTSNRFYAWGLGAAVLGKTKDDATGEDINNKRITVEVYKGERGNETITSPVTTISTNLKLHGAIVRDTWVICEFIAGTFPNDDVNAAGAWYIVGALRGNSWPARVREGQANVSTQFCAVDTTIRVDLYYGTAAGQADDQKSALIVDARVLYSPVLDKERVQIEWSGTVFIITRTELDGGFFGKTFVSGIAKGATDYVDTTGLIGNSDVAATALQVKNPLGQIGGNKIVRVALNRGGPEIVSGEC